MKNEDVEVFAERLYNAIGFVLSHNQQVAYQKYIIRAEARAPDVKQIKVMSGKYSLVAGSYRHALSKYFKSTSLILSLDKL
jgi:hypothetical protein